MSIPFLACALITLISALVSLGFSALAIRRETGEARTMALYASARSVALAVAATVPFFTGSTGWLQAIATIMIVVQAGDALIGVTIRDAMKTYGPAATAAFNLVALIWLLTAL